VLITQTKVINLLDNQSKFFNRRQVVGFKPSDLAELNPPNSRASHLPEMLRRADDAPRIGFDADYWPR
jgi:hypothetical protein